MFDFVNYIYESSISLGLFTLLYFVFLQRETFFRTNRLFLLFALCFSVFLPLIHLRVLEPQPVMLGEITVTPYRNLLEAVSVYGTSVSSSVVQRISTSTYILAIYLLGFCFFAVRLVLRLVQISLLISRNEVVRERDMKLVLLDRDVTPFSFLSYVFAGKNLKTQNGWEKMLIHEFEHVKQGHSFDILVLEVIAVFQWFNPFFWLLKRLVRENHEYLADRAVITHEVNPEYYKKLLLQQFIGPQFELANNFNYSLIKKRIQMMSKIKSSKLARIKLAGGLLVAIALIITFSLENKVVAQETKPEKVTRITIQDGEKSVTLQPESDEKISEIARFFKESSNYELVSEEGGELVLRHKPAKIVDHSVQTKIFEPERTIDGEPVFFIVEEMPVYPGGEDALRQFIANNIHYPVEAQEKAIQGQVYVCFVVDKTGKVRNAQIARGVAPSLDKEALRVVSSLPQWTPGKQKGQAVAVSYTVPISFKLH